MIGLDNDTVFAQLFLNQYHLLSPLHHEVPTRIKRALDHAGKLCFISTRQNTFTTPQHDGETANIDISLDNALSSSVLDGDHDWCCICYVTKSTFIGSHSLVDGLHVVPIRETYVDVGVLEPKTRVDVGSNFVVRFHDILNIHVDKIVEGIYVLLHKAFHFQKSGQQEPFVLPSFT